MAALAGFLVLGQTLDTTQLVGMFLVVGASAVVTRRTSGADAGPETDVGP